MSQTLTEGEAWRGLSRPGRDVASAANLLLLAAMLAAFAVAAVSRDHGRALVLLAMAPMVEEAVFRAGVQEALLNRGTSARNSNVATALLFAAAHVAVRPHDMLAFAVALPALLIGWLYCRFGSLRICIAAHMLMNITWVSCNHWLLAPDRWL